MANIFDIKSMHNKNHYYFSDNYAPLMLPLPFKSVKTEILFEQTKNKNIDKNTNSKLDDKEKEIAQT